MFSNRKLVLISKYTNNLLCCLGMTGVSQFSKFSIHNLHNKTTQMQISNCILIISMEILLEYFYNCLHCINAVIKVSCRQPSVVSVFVIRHVYFTITNNGLYCANVLLL